MDDLEKLKQERERLISIINQKWQTKKRKIYGRASSQEDPKQEFSPQKKDPIIVQYSTPKSKHQTPQIIVKSGIPTPPVISNSISHQTPKSPMQPPTPLHGEDDTFLHISDALQQVNSIIVHFTCMFSNEARRMDSICIQKGRTNSKSTLRMMVSFKL